MLEDEDTSMGRQRHFDRWQRVGASARRWRRSAATVAGVATVVGAVAAVHGPGPTPIVSPAARDTLTFARDVAPILYRSCAGCHRPEGPAPFSLLTYRDAKQRAELIVAVTATRRMPPWLPAAGRGRFADERRLGDREIATLLQWVAQGAVEGDPADLPARPSWADGWLLGEPDLVVRMPEAYTLHASGPEVFRNVVIPARVSATRYVAAVELHPGNPRAVHHAMVMVDRTPASRQLDLRDPEPGFDGMHVGNARMPEGFFLGWTPGRLPFREPEGFAWPLEPGTDIVLQLHLRPTGRPERIAATVGLYFADRPPTRLPTTLRLGSETIDITAGVPDYVIEDRYVLPVDVQVLGVYPHAHYLGKDLRAFAELPDGSERWLLHIPDWDFNWQDAYRYAEPVDLPQGTTVVMRYTYDNSAANPRNPNDPPRRVVFGPHSVDEMGDLWIRVLPRDAENLTILQRDVTRKNLATRLAGLQQMVALRPDDATAQADLAGLLFALGRYDEAIVRYGQALRIVPGDGNLHYNLGLALQSRGRLDEAIAHFRLAIRAIPAHVDAYNNLGNALMGRGDVEWAIAAYGRALALDSLRADVHHNLGLALTATGRVADGLAHARQAARIAPAWPAPLLATAWTLATTADDRAWDPAEAVRLAERAVTLTRRHDPGALHTLGVAYAAAGEYLRAIVTAEEALALARRRGDEPLAREIEALVSLYVQQKPYRQPTGRQEDVPQ